MTFLPVLLILPAMAVSGIPTWYKEARQAFIDEEKAMRVGAKLVLNANEQLVNTFLMNLKNETIQQSIWTNTPYPPSVSFFKSKPWIDNSTIFQVIKRMPKGGGLHLHDTALASLDWVVKSLTYTPNLYTKVIDGRYPQRRYKIADTHPESDWQSVSDLRKSFNDSAEFDKRLVREMTIWVENPFLAYPSINDVWTKFETYFTTIYDLVGNLTNMRLYLEESLQEFYDDGVQYMELKTVPWVDSNGNDVTDDYVEMVQEVANSFKQQHPDFIGVKVILAGRRSQSQQADVVNRTLALMKKFPDLVKGFDLLQQEDNTHMTYDFINDLLKSDHSVVSYFFHAGETDWTQWVDLNLIDSVLLNASRIGHGFAAYHHPKVLEAIIKKGIAIELNPISNQALGLVYDLRNHPGAFLLANGAPVVVSSDGNPVWFANPLSHDFYMAFMGLGAVYDDLKLLKQLAMNSITYSAMTSAEKVDALAKWQNKWNTFIADVISIYKLSSVDEIIG
ncbi:adenosine deaminase 2 [Biomphalaria pfeifferi]|uniref:adenosine deaminase n=1 Tax=Biomphalaria pfeifferi TaxID=112525 RepID=A0AAD8BAJ1_BIOPF|nr:adenosine deaminase 2 [Biomphalaria pfeifferi]